MQMTIDNRSAVKMVHGLGYVVLHGTERALAVYRIRADNLVRRRMKR